MAPADYREQLGLNNETGLVKPALFQKLSARNPEHLAPLKPKVSVFAALTTEER